MSEHRVDTVCIIGTGLIGGSLALAIKQAGFCREIAGGRNMSNLCWIILIFRDAWNVEKDTSINTEVEYNDFGQTKVCARWKRKSHRRPSQIYEAVVEGAVLFLILWWFGKRAKRIGLVSAVFFWAYGLNSGIDAQRVHFSFLRKRIEASFGIIKGGCK